MTADTPQTQSYHMVLPLPEKFLLWGDESYR